MFEDGLLIFDGGVATELYKKGYFINKPFEELNISAPADVEAVHRAYIDAGADIITTNTFLCRSEQQEFLEAGIECAVRAARRSDVKISLSLGPTTEKDIFLEYVALAKTATNVGGFDVYMLETFSSVEALIQAAQGIRSIDHVRPIIASMTEAEKMPLYLLEPFVDALGLNCGQGPAEIYLLVEKILPTLKKPLVVRPNAGKPSSMNGRTVYMCSPDYMGKFAKRYVELGARGVGGCCGTGPEHIAAIVSACAMLKAKKRACVAAKPAQNVEKIPWQKRPQSKIGQCLLNDGFFFSVELNPPKGADLGEFFERVDEIEAAGIDFVNVPDSPRGHTRISSLHVSVAQAYRKKKLTILPHFTTRDRNLIALQSDLIGAFANGVRDVLCVTGDPPKSDLKTTGVFDVDSIGLVSLVSTLNSLEASFGIGIAVNPTAKNLHVENERFIMKCAAGADFAITQPIFSPKAYLDWVKDKTLPHIVGIWPLVSLRNAEFLAKEVPGIVVPPEALLAMETTKNPEEAIEKGLELALEVMLSCAKKARGFCVSAPLGKSHVALELISRFSRLCCMKKSSIISGATSGGKFDGEGGGNTRTSTT